MHTQFTYRMEYRELIFSLPMKYLQYSYLVHQATPQSSFASRSYWFIPGSLDQKLAILLYSHYSTYLMAVFS